MHHKILSLLVVLTAIVFTGCVAQKTMPSRVQSGDVVYLNLGGVKRNVNNSPPTLTNIQATITDSANNTYPLRLVQRFSLFPSYVSKYSTATLNKNDSFIAGELLPYEGAFYVIAQLSNADGTAALPLAPGPAIVHVSSSGFNLDMASSYDGDYNNIPVDILSGSADLDAVSQSLGALSYYENGNYRMLSPSDQGLLSNVYGMRVRVTCGNSGTLDYRVVPMSHDPNLVVTQKTYVSGSSKIIEASMFNPLGFKDFTDPTWKAGVSTKADLKLALVRAGGGAPNCTTLDTAYSYYIDVDGNEIPSVEVVMSGNLSK